MMAAMIFQASGGGGFAAFDPLGLMFAIMYSCDHAQQRQRKKCSHARGLRPAIK